MSDENANTAEEHPDAVEIEQTVEHEDSLPAHYQEPEPMNLPANQTAAIMQVISQVARDPRADMEKMERLMNMHEKMQARDAEAAFWEAMPKLQADLPTIPKRGEMKQSNREKTQFWTIPFAKFEDVIEAIRPIMKKHGFSLTFQHKMMEHGVIHTTGILAHKKGHKERDEFASLADKSGSKNDIQAIGSARSYGKRYTTASLLGLALGGEDDDGASAGDMGAQRPEPESKSSSGGATPIHERAQKLLRSKLEASGKEESALCEHFGVAKAEDLLMSQVNDALEWAAS